jgi:hypothetical protein
MQEFFFTCGQSHVHQIGGGKVWDKDSVLQVNAENEDLARKKVFDMFGPKWSMSYTKETISMEYYPKGICAVIITA